MIGRLSRNFDGAFYSGGDKNVGRDERPCKFYFVDILSYYADIYIYIYRTSKPILHKNLCGGRTLSLEKFSSAFRARRDRFYEGV